MKKLILYAVFILLLLLTTACGNTAEATDENGLITVRIGFPSSGQAWPGDVLGVSQVLGYLEEELNEAGYTFEFFSFVGAAPAIHEALVANELDYVVYAGMASVLSRANGIEHTLLSVTSWGSIWALMVDADSGIYTLEDLEGRRVAYTRGASPHMYLLRVLNEAGLTIDDIDALNTTIPEGVAGIVTGTIDATVVANTQADELIESGHARVIHRGFDANPDTFYEPFVFIGRTAFHNEHPQAADAILRAFERARADGLQDTDEYFRLISEHSSIPLDVVLSTAEHNLYASVPLNLDEKYITALQDILFFLQENGLTNGDIDFDAWLGNE